MSNSRKKQRHIENMKKFSERTQRLQGKDLPLFHNLLRQLYRRAHPDLMKSHSETMSRINDTSMQELNGVLSTVKGKSEFPQAIDKRFTFYMKNTTTSEYQKYELLLKTSGGDCRKQLRTSFEQFFQLTGICNTSFQWDAGYFPALTNTEAEKVLEEELQERERHQD